MPDYKEMYLTLLRATEQAVDTLIAAQLDAEALYVSEGEPDITVLYPDKPPAPDGPDEE